MQLANLHVSLKAMIVALVALLPPLVSSLVMPPPQQYQATTPDPRSSYFHQHRSSSALFLHREREGGETEAAPDHDQDDECDRACIGQRRREILGSWFGALLPVTVGLLNAPSNAAAVYNPLNLKGSYWETGKLYQKERDVDLPSDPRELLASLDEMAAALESLSAVAEEGRIDDLKRSLRGGAVSESRLRITGNALIDMILDDDRGYAASERFRVFLLKFDALDGTVTAAARRAKADGGVVSTLGLAAVAPLGAINEVAKISSEPSLGNDPRFEVLVALGDAAKALRSFNKAAGDAIRAQQ